MPAPRGVPGLGGTCSQGVPGWGCLLPGGRCLLLGGWGAWSGGMPGGDPPDGYCCERYASYWNAFLYILKQFITRCSKKTVEKK